MKIQECVLSEAVVTADSAEAALWDAIVVPEAIKERLRNHTLLSLLVRPELPFAVTALHGLCTLYGPPGAGKPPWRAVCRRKSRASFPAARCGGLRSTRMG